MTPLIRQLKARKAAIDAMPYRPTKQNPTPPANRAHERPVLCVDNGKRFPSLRDAAQWLSDHLQQKCTSAALGYAIRSGRKHKGILFRYEE